MILHAALTPSDLRVTSLTNPKAPSPNVLPTSQPSFSIALSAAFGMVVVRIER